MIIEVKDNVIITEWWTSKEEEDGKKQITEETVRGKNKGRSNETTDNEQAILEYERKIKKKKEEGYVENREDAILGEEIVVSSTLTQSFAPCKPISKLKKDDEEGKSEVTKINEELIKKKIGKLLILKEKRGNIEQYLDKISQTATTDENLLPHIIKAVNAKVSLGEICNSLRNVWGEYRPKDII